MDQKMTLNSQQLADRLGVGTTMVKKMAEEYEDVSRQLLPRSTTNGWLFPADAVDVIERARAYMDKFGSFRSGLEIVLLSRTASMRSLVPSIAVVSSDEAREIRLAGIELEARMRLLFDHVFDRLTILDSDRALEDRQQVVLMRDVQSSIREIRGRSREVKDDVERIKRNVIDISDQAVDHRLHSRFLIGLLICTLIVCAGMLFSVRFLKWK
jgi:hypothetical protein